MIKKIIASLKPKLKYLLEKSYLIIPDKEKPPKLNNIRWERFYVLSILINDSLNNFNSYELKNLLIIEAGVGYGDTFLFLALIAEKLGMNLIGFDSFCGFPEIINKKDRRLFGKPIAKGQWNVSSIKSIRNRLKNSGVGENFLNNNLELVQGFFEDSLRNFQTQKKILFLHLDVDLYSSYKTCLEYLWQHVIVGGVVVFDEYQDPKWPDAKEAIDEFFNEKGINVELDQLTKRGFVKKT
tara:strand:- start:68 stop:784 length:717 start_codon:yes stop_codon:yes gene_type:complete